jgi:hypothetical protein
MQECQFVSKRVTMTVQEEYFKCVLDEANENTVKLGYIELSGTGKNCSLLYNRDSF